ncbi:hypothetical protein FK535_07555 [Mycolicibacterium sp. 018/SC-01/001]|uniref:hypothetical protein n=1 Tax=Mycolicibacterium sp. 018/SC-01/001 TaxID=2592069 RepID=UPI00117D9258|nr:hypothetical protein [Mycolicibacterium sp. 018/SC-01/001]TRW86309.1 hypothetical protein FK535_07555 [Mycolicibacterium sp. 018/SC-01/001]
MSDFVGKVPESCGQIIAVYVDSIFDQHGNPVTTGILECFQRDVAPKPLSPWKKVIGNGAPGWSHDITAQIGKKGVAGGADDSLTTPAGSFPITTAIGRVRAPFTKMPYHFIQEGDVWDEGYRYWAPAWSRGESTTYNTRIRESDAKKGQETEDLNQDAYEYAVFVDHNPTRRPGWGCAIFLHCQDTDTTTLGCIAVKQPVMEAIFAWLDPDSQPYMSILVGVA